MRPLSNFQPISQLDLRWPLTLVCDPDLTNIWRFPYYIYKPSFITIRLHLFKGENFKFQPYNLTSDDLVIWTLTLWTWKFPHYIIKPSFVPIRLQLFKWGEFYIFSPSYTMTLDDLWPWYVTFDGMNIWSIPYYINKPSLVTIRLQLFKWGHFHIFSLSYNLTSNDLWPWYDLWPHQQMRVPMLHLLPNFGWNPSKHVEGRAKC